MNTERLKRLAEHLETVPDELFDMTTWADRGECGTVCCALGHACSVPEFKAAGLKLVWDTDGSATPTLFPQEIFGFRASEIFFGLDEAEAKYLFSDGSYDETDDDGEWEATTPQAVAARIRELVARHEPATA